MLYKSSLELHVQIKMSSKRIKIKNVLTFVTVQSIAKKSSNSLGFLDVVTTSKLYFSFNFKISLTCKKEWNSQGTLGERQGQCGKTTHVFFKQPQTERSPSYKNQPIPLTTAGPST